MIEFRPLNQDIPSGLVSGNSQEFRAVVMQGGNRGDTAVLRSEAGIFRARIEGESIRDGERLTLKIHKSADGTIRLKRTLPNPTKNLPHIPLPLYHSYARFLSIRFGDKISNAPYGHHSRNSIKAKAPLDELREILPNRMHAAIDSLESTLLSGMEPEFSFEMETHPGGDFESDHLTNQSMEGSVDRKTNDPDSTIDLAFARMGKEPFYFFCSFGFEAIGRIAVFIHSPDSTFEKLNVILTAEKKSVEEILMKNSPAWLTLMHKSGISAASVSVLPRNDVRIQYLNVTI